MLKIRRKILPLLTNKVLQQFKINTLGIGKDNRSICFETFFAIKTTPDLNWPFKNGGVVCYIL